MSRVQQDTFIDDTEEFCPLCVEEFDIQDRYFRPCPCGYQVCQFCYNNIKTNLNNLCPACRRPYDEKTIEWKVISAEEIKADQNKKNRQQNEKRKLEAQKREIDALNRKHLAGLRVIQKNLVYVTGLNPRIPEEDLLQTLRGKSYFGQYGKIIKIVVNKRTTAQGGSGGGYQGGGNAQGLGVYVTFSRKEDAEICIDAVDSSQNGDRTLRATYGTTKYCSAYLRNEACPNKNCMFLHEPGEDADSYDRQGMSTFTVRQQEGAPSQAPPPRHQPPVAAAAPSHHVHPPPTQQQGAQMARVSSHQGGPSSSMGDSGESSALPSTANWAKNPPTPAVRSVAPVIEPQGSAVLSKGSAPSPRSGPAVPMVRGHSQDSGKSGSSNEKGPAAIGSGGGSNPGPVGKPPVGPPANNQAPIQVPEGSSSSSPPSPTRVSTGKAVVRSSAKPSHPELPIQVQEHLKRLENCVRAISNPKFRFVFSADGMSEEDLADLEKMPPMFDRNGGKRRREMTDRARAQQRQQHDEAENDISQPQPPVGTMAAAPGLLPLNMAGRGNTPSQREMLKEVATNHPQQQALGAIQQQENLQHQQALRVLAPAGVLHPQQQQIQQSFAAFSSMGNPQQQQQTHSGPLHTRQTSRYNFANDNPAAASTSVNPRVNVAHMTEQLRMMPQQAQQHQMHNQQQLAAQFYGAGSAPSLGGGILGSTVQQPPPGLKSAPTPPAPGMGGIPMGGLHGLGGQFTGLGLGGHHNKSESSDALLRELMRGNGGLGNAGLGGRTGDVGDLGDPSILQVRMAQQQQQQQPQQQMQHHQGGIQTGQQGAKSQGDATTRRESVQPKSTLSQAQMSSGVGAQEQKLTPGVMDEDEFPALAPPAAKENVVALPSTVNTLKVKKSSVGPAGKKGGESSEASEGAKLESARHVPFKGKPVLPSVNTKAAVASSSGPRTVSPAVVTPSTISYERTTPLSPAPPTTTGGVAKQGPRMIRILSANSNTPSPALKTPIGGGIGESDTASNGGSSRPVSPPPNSQQPAKKGKSKSALKKERVAAARRESEEKEKEKGRERLERESVMQAPVVGRMKKKGRKKGAAAGFGESTLGSGDYADEKEDEKEPDASNAVSETATSTPVPARETVNIASTTKVTASAPKLVPTAITHSYTTATTTATLESDEVLQPTKTTAQLLADVQEGTGIVFKDLDMFKPLATHRWEHYVTSDEIQLIKAAVADGKTQVIFPHLSCGDSLPLRNCGVVNTTCFTSPGGVELPGLTPEQQARYTLMEERRRQEKSWEMRPVAPSGIREFECQERGTPAEVEKAFYMSRKESEGLEKKLEKLLKRNKKLIGLA